MIGYDSRLTRRRKRARVKAKKTMKNADWKRYHKLTKDMKKQLREAHNDYVTEIFSDGTTRGINKKASLSLPLFPLSGVR